MPPEFNPPVRNELRLQILELVDQLISICPKLKSHYGKDLAMDDPDLLVSEVARFDLGEGLGRLTVARSTPEARPPFEWLAEVTSDIDEHDFEYLKHYLIRENDIVLAQRKVLTEIDDREANIIIADLEQVLAQHEGE